MKKVVTLVIVAVVCAVLSVAASRVTGVSIHGWRAWVNSAPDTIYGICLGWLFRKWEVEREVRGQ